MGGNDLHSNVFSYFLFLYKTVKKKKKTIKSDLVFPFPLSQCISHVYVPASSLAFSRLIEYQIPFTKPPR